MTDALARIREWFRRFLGMWHPGRRDADIEEELRLHLELAEEDFQRRGFAPEEAARLGRVHSGGHSQAMESQREQRAFPWPAACWMDTKLGLRMLRKSWGLTLVGGLAIALVTATAAGVFSVLDRVEGSQLPLEDGERLVAIQPYDLSGRGELDTPIEDFLRWRQQLESVVDIGAYRTVTNRSLTVPNGPVERVSVAAMTAAAFGLARVEPILGRALAEGDEQEGAEPVVVIAHDAWRRLFSSDPDVLGKPIRLNETIHTVIGVMPEGFAFPVNHRFWIPLRTDPLAYTPNDRPAVFVIAHLAPGIAIDEARTEVARVGLLEGGLRPSLGRVETRVVPYAFTFTDGIRENRWQIRLVLLLITLLLIPPSANIAILLHARNVTRQQEFAARLVLGASRTRIVVQLFVESLVLALAAAGVGLLIAREGLTRFQAVVDHELGSTMPFWMDFTLSPKAVPLVVGLAVLAALISGLVPGLWTTSRTKRSGLQALGSQSSRRLGRAWTALVVAQVGVTTAVLPVVGGMTWVEARPSILGRGFDLDEFLSARLELDPSVPSGPEDAASRFAGVQAELVRRLEQQPGIRGVTLSSSANPGGGRWATIGLDGADSRGDSRATSESFTTRHHEVGLSYFEVLDADFLSGREFTADDFENERWPVIVNQTFVHDLIGGENPLGRRVAYLSRGPEASAGRWYEIVGVVEDVPANTGMRRIYHPMRPGALHPVSMAIRIDPTTDSGVVGSVWETAASLPELRVSHLRSLDTVNEQQEFINRVETLAPVVLAIIILFFAVAGIHTLSAFTVATRTREIGIRAALGANPRQITLDILKRALVPVAAGAMAGLLGAGLVSLLLTRTIDEMAVGSILVVSLCAGAIGMMVIACLASAGPARRAIRVAPTESLRDS